MVTPVNNAPAPPPIEDTGYSKLAVTGLFLALIPLLVVWTALTIACLPLKLWNICNKEQIHWVNALIGEYLTVLALGFRYFRSEQCHYTPGEGRPVLLVHGYLHNASGWYAQIERLREAGVGPIYSIDLGDGTIGGKFWSIRDYAKQVEAKVKEIGDQTGRKDIALVGHSMGGVICSLVAKQGQVTDVFTIGSPLHGAPIAGCLGIGPNGREMIPGSPLLEEVQQKITNSKVRFHHFGSKCDGLVPCDSALMAENNTIFEDLGHAQLMTSEKVSEKLCELLGR